MPICPDEQKIPAKRNRSRLYIPPELVARIEKRVKEVEEEHSRLPPRPEKDKKSYKIPPMPPWEFPRPSTCRDALKTHHDLLKEDPERLPTKFLIDIVGCDCSRQTYPDIPDKYEGEITSSSPMKLKLTIELVPGSSWGNNVRKCVSVLSWDKIRKTTYRKYGYKCGLCDATGKITCHEMWNYDDEHHIQRLEGFIALCTMCHFIKHIGLAGILANQGKLDFDKLVEHFMKVNKCDQDTFEAHYDEELNKWFERTKFDWKIDFGEFNSIIKN
jgi:hypothetical protein